MELFKEVLWGLRQIIEAMVSFVSIYLLSGKRIMFNKVIISGILGGIAIYLVRLLPIHTGVHTIILALIYILIAVKICDIVLIKSINAIIILVIMIYAFELIVLSVYQNVLKMNIDIILEKTPIGILASLGPLVFIMLFSLLISYVKGRIKKKNIA